MFGNVGVGVTRKMNPFEQIVSFLARNNCYYYVKLSE